jgi:hypothetical protein
MKFRATIALNGINPYVRVGADRARRLRPGWRRPMPVLVQIDGQPDPPWRINMMPIGDGGFYLYLHAAVRNASKAGVGDRVTVALAFDAGYRGGPMHAMPADLVQRLAAEPRCGAAWDALPPSRKKEVLRYLAGLKSAAARQRNIERALRVLAGARERFMARDWNEPAASAPALAPAGSERTRSDS